jgi:hypothetical protein
VIDGVPRVRVRDRDVVRERDPPTGLDSARPEVEVLAELDVAVLDALLPGRATDRGADVVDAGRRSPVPRTSYAP